MTGGASGVSISMSRLHCCDIVASCAGCARRRVIGIAPPHRDDCLCHDGLTLGDGDGASGSGEDFHNPIRTASVTGPRISNIVAVGERVVGVHAICTPRPQLGRMVGKEACAWGDEDT